MSQTKYQHIVVYRSLKDTFDALYKSRPAYSNLQNGAMIYVDESHVRVYRRGTPPATDKARSAWNIELTTFASHARKANINLGAEYMPAPAKDGFYGAMWPIMPKVKAADLFGEVSA